MRHTIPHLHIREHVHLKLDEKIEEPIQKEVLVALHSIHLHHLPGQLHRADNEQPDLHKPAESLCSSDSVCFSRHYFHHIFVQAHPVHLKNQDRPVHSKYTKQSKLATSDLHASNETFFYRSS